jgi:hypothetical protein
MCILAFTGMLFFAFFARPLRLLRLKAFLHDLSGLFSAPPAAQALDES